MTFSTLSSSILALAVIANHVGAAALPSYNVDPKSVSVSGLSSGGYMAAQLGVAYSGTFQTGFGVFAGGPFDCARNQQYSMCMNNMTPNTQTPNKNMAAWSGNQIDNLANLKTRKIFLEVGTSDTTVGPNLMNALQAQLQPYSSAENTAYIKRAGQAHVFPTNFDGQGNNQCGSSTSPYIANCGYDGAEEVLKWMYGNLNPRASTAQGSFVTFDQTGKYGAAGMASSGSLYVPKACQDGKTACKLHVALHGCQQTMSAIGNKYTVNTGYNEWADTNNIMILYPQGTPDSTLHQAWQGLLPNPYGCWDWVGWYGDNADQKGGVQMAAIVAQVNQITNGFQGQGPSSTSGGSIPSSTTSSPPAATTTSSGPTAPLYGQCGGIGWTGPTNCASGTCKSWTLYYSQCLP